jgi:membrane-associated phospholipid phosphatase
MKTYRSAALSAAGLSVLFLVVYGACNLFTAARDEASGGGVPSLFFEWERHTPFVPLMIVPYMSIDLFFVMAPFLAATDKERRSHARRVIVAIAVAAACFLAFPLKFGFERPHVDGILGVVFNNFRKLDLPYNELPSLHIALRTILADIFLRHSKGTLRITLSIWFSLVGLSTLVTFQHHICDVIAGFALGLLCVQFIQEHPLRLPFTPNPRIAAYYALGAGAFLAPALLIRSGALVLLWPAASLTLMAISYLYLGPGIFRKRDGRLPLGTRLLLWPVLLGQYLSLLYYSRRSRPWDELSPGLWIGRRLSGREATTALSGGVRAIVDLTGEFSENRPFRGVGGRGEEFAYLNIPVLDLTAPTPDQIDRAVDFIQMHRSRGITYLHCKLGYSRTAAVAGAYLISSDAAGSVDDAVRLLRQARPGIIIRPEALAALVAWDASRSARS